VTEKVGGCAPELNPGDPPPPPQAAIKIAIKNEIK
jgi:hypothetical protein